MNRIGDIDPKRVGITTRPNPASRPVVEIPAWVIDRCVAIRTKFAQPQDGRGAWDRSDDVAYGGVFARMGQEHSAAVLAALRQRFTWRPSVAEVLEVADELSGVAPKNAITGADAAARQVVKRPLALPPHPDNPGRRAFQEKLARMKGELGSDYLRVVKGGKSEEEAA